MGYREASGQTGLCHLTVTRELLHSAMSGTKSDMLKCSGLGSRVPGRLLIRRPLAHLVCLSHVVFSFLLKGTNPLGNGARSGKTAASAWNGKCL